VASLVRTLTRDVIRSIVRLVERGIALFSPASLFASGEEGVWYDPSDLSTMYQDSAGTTPVTGLEQPVGLLLDKSKGGPGPELVTNGDFSDGTTGWTVSTPGTSTVTVSGGTLSLQGGAAEYPSVSQSILSVNKYYRVTFTKVSAATANSDDLQLRLDSSGLSNFNYGTAAAGTYSFVGICRSTSGFVVIKRGTSTSAIEIANVSVKELPGNHAYQGTSTARPVLRARYNLLTYSEQFQGGINWIKAAQAVITTDSATAPDNTSTADLLKDNNGGGTGSIFVYQNVTLAVNQSYKLSFYLKDAGRTGYAAIRTFSFDSTASGYTYVDLVNGTIVSADAAHTSTITNAGNGWYRVVVGLTMGATDATGSVAVYLSQDGTTTAVDFDDTSGCYIWGAQLVANSVFPSNVYQRIEAAPSGNGTVTYATGADYPNYLYFDGSDDSLSTASIDFSATDEMSVFAGVTKNSDGTASMFAELSASFSANYGSFAFLVPTGLAVNSFNFVTSGTIIANNALANQLTAPITGVLTGLADISADINTTRKNGSLVQTVTTDQGTGNFGNYPLYIGRRGGTTLPFNGSLYQLIVRGKTSTEGEIKSTENYVAGKLGRSITWAYDYLVDDAGNFITTDSGDQIYVAETVTFS